MGMSPCRYMIPQSLQQPPPPPVRTMEHPPACRKARLPPCSEKSTAKASTLRRGGWTGGRWVWRWRVWWASSEEMSEQRSKKAPPFKQAPPPPTGEEGDEEYDEDKPKDPTSRLKRWWSYPRTLRISANAWLHEVYRPNRQKGQEPPLQQEGGAFSALLVSALAALAQIAGEVAYNAIKRKIKGEGNVRQKMGWRLKTLLFSLKFWNNWNCKCIRNFLDFLYYKYIQWGMSSE